MIIYKNFAIVRERPKEYYLEKNGLYLIKGWRKVLDGRMVSKEGIIYSFECFFEELKIFGIKKLLYEISKNRIPVTLIYEPLVSVILPFYNAKDTLDDAIVSIKNQSYRNIEIILINDGSTDGDYEDYENVIKIPENKGVYFARNLGIRNAKGDFICFQDADDVSQEDRIKISVNQLIKHQVNFVLTNSVIVKNLDEVSKVNQVGVSVALASLMFKRRVIKENGYYDEETRHSGDLEYLDRYYYRTFGEYKFDNFWYWLNYRLKEDNFYYHIYDVLYVIRNSNENSITRKNKIGKRIKYLNERRRFYSE